jgi:hypothetical protein
MALRGRRIDDISMIQGKLWCTLDKFFKACTSQNALNGGVMAGLAGSCFKETTLKGQHQLGG